MEQIDIDVNFIIENNKHKIFKPTFQPRKNFGQFPPCEGRPAPCESACESSCESSCE